MKLILEELNPAKWTKEQLSDLFNFLKEKAKSKILDPRFNLKDDKIEIELGYDIDDYPFTNFDDWEYYIIFDNNGSLYSLNDKEEDAYWGYGVDGYEVGDDELILKEIFSMYKDIRERLAQEKEDHEEDYLELQADKDYWDEVNAKIDQARGK